MQVSVKSFAPLALAGILLVSGIVLVAVLVFFSYNANLERELDNKRALLDTVQRSIYDPTFYWRTFSVYPRLKQIVIDEASKSPGVLFLRLVRPDSGKIVYSQEGDIEAGTVVEDLPRFSEEASVRDALYKGRAIKEISIRGLGGEALWMGVDTQFLANRAISFALPAGTLVGISVIVTYILIYYLVRRYMIMPLEEIIRVSQEFGKGNLNLRIPHNFLLKEVGNLASSLNRMMDTVKEQREREQMLSRLKTEFISVAAHQLRTPLSAIKWTFQMLLDGDVGELTEEQRLFIERGSKTNERMIALINALLNVSRIEEGKFGYEFKQADFVDLVERIIEEEKIRAEQNSILFEFKKPKQNIPKLKIDPEKITMAVTNLIDNAIKYTLPGGKIVVNVELKGKEVEFSVKDTGIGIPEHQISRLFTKFFRGENAIRLQTEGSGLGLFLVKNIIARHGGKIWVESKEGKGSTFFFTLPIEKEAIPSEEEFRSFMRAF